MGFLALADWAIEGGAAGLRLAADQAWAVASGTGLALAVVDGEIVLEIAELAIGADVIPQRRAAGSDCRLEDRPDRLGKPVGTGERFSFSVGERARRPVRRQTGMPERLTDIDVAQAGNQALVHQYRLQRRLTAG